jgi:protein SCO1/2
MKPRFLAAFAVFTAFVFPALGWCERPLPFFDVQDMTPYWDSEKAPGDQPGVPATVKPFALVDQDGKAVNENNLKGKISLVNFFFGECGSTCPTMMSTLGKFHAHASDVWLYSISVTPEQDTPRVLKDYASARGLKLQNWSLVTGTYGEVYRIGKEVFQADRSVGGRTRTDSFTHSTSVYIVDRNLRVRGIYDTASPLQMKQLTQDVAQLEKER